MDTEAYSDDEDIPAPSPDEPVFTSSGGGMFAGSQYFTIAGGTFNNIMNATPTMPSDFRMIPMGDIDLQQELMVHQKSGVVGRRPERNCVRRVYSAKTDDRNSKVTVAVYQGSGAEEDWRRDTEVYMSVRHPNILQIYGGASYGNIHATVFHGDLVSIKQFLAPQSPMMTVYLYACYSEELNQVNDYFMSMWQMDLRYWECTIWIRTSTGRLSVDLVSLDHHFVLHPFSEAPLPQTPTPLNITEVMAIESLGLAQYHDICSLYLGKYRHDSISPSATVHIGGVISWPSGHRDKEHVEIALPAEIDVDYSSWRILGDGEGDLMGIGWTRYRTDDIFNTELTLVVSSYDPGVWLSEANHVFSRLQFTSNLEDYAVVNGILFIITIENVGGDPPGGFLFLCPTEDFQTGPASFKWPSRPAYWSLDPSGVDRLSTEEAARLGFPPFQLITQIQGKAWDDNVYAGLPKFHQTKGFDPESQEVARNLGYPLYKLSRDVDPPFAHVDDFDEAEDEVDAEDKWADAQNSLHEDDGCEEGSDAEDGMGEAGTCIKRPAPEVDQESMHSGHIGTNDEANLKPQTATDRATGGGFIHRIFGALQHSLVVEADSDNIDSDPISPFLV